MGAIECPLCQVVAEKVERRPKLAGQSYIPAYCARHGSYTLVSSTHDARYDEEEVREAFANLPGHQTDQWIILAHLGTSSFTGGHTRVHVASSGEYSYRTIPQELADRITATAQEVVVWFHLRGQARDSFERQYIPLQTKREIPDGEVLDRIQGFQYAMDREIARNLGFRYGAWPWRFDADWREKHQAWVRSYEEEVVKPNAERDSYRRYDLSSLPQTVQRGLVSRWEKIWEEYEGQYDPTSGFGYD